MPDTHLSCKIRHVIRPKNISGQSFTFFLNKLTFIACEDTRRSGQLLRKLGAKAPLISFYQHNTRNRIPQLIELLKGGQSIALISDAGLPGISDPGEELIAEAKKSDLEVICIPGPCAATTALVCSGLPSKRFCFEGFLPRKEKDRTLIIDTISKETRTTIIYESPHKLIKLLEDLSKQCGENRPLQVSRELTKIHEENIGSTIKSVLDYFKNKKPKGELTLILGGAPPEQVKDINNSELIHKMQNLIDMELSSIEAAKKISDVHFLGQGTLYPDIIESVPFFGGPTAKIKSHHNVGGLPKRMKLKVIELSLIHI